MRKAKPKPPADVSERVEMPGVRPATFKLVGRAEDSFLLYRSSRKLGTARVEKDGSWSAQVGEGKSGFVARAFSGRELLNLVGAYLLAGEAREAAARPVEEANPDLRIKGKKSPEERLSIEFARRAQAARIADLDELLAQLGKSIRPARKR